MKLTISVLVGPQVARLSKCAAVLAVRKGEYGAKYAIERKFKEFNNSKNILETKTNIIIVKLSRMLNLTE